MKSILRFLTLFSFVILVSCQKSNDGEFTGTRSEDISIADCLALKPGIDEIINDLFVLGAYSQNATKTDYSAENIDDIMQEICGIMNPYSYTFINKCNISIGDINEMFDTEYKELSEAEYEIVGFSLFMYALGSNIDIQTKGGTLTDCFLEATGIAAGIALVGGMGATVLGKEVTKKLITTVVKKVGVRVIGGIGLALTAGEMIYCMVTE